MGKIGILGGTFNPVHLEHVSIAKNAINELQLDFLFIMPTYLSPHKTSVPAPANDRLNMLKIAFDGVDKVVVSNYEISKEGKSYTYLTLEHFKKVFPNDSLYFIVGDDMLYDFPTWKKPERIMELCDLAVFKRVGYYICDDERNEYFVKRFNKPFIRLNYVGKEISSTKTRTYLSLDLKDEQLDERVTEYIRANKLYRGDKYCAQVLKNEKPTRVLHTANVVICALKKAKELSLDEEKVRLSALLHDIAKYLDPKDFPDFSLPDGVPNPVVHAFLGAYYVKKVLGICDEEIIGAIKYHTSGKANMTTLEKLIFVADMIEDGRDYDGVEKLREYYKQDFEKCFIECLKEELKHLLEKKSYIYVETLNAYAYYVKGKN